jgi:hypothetical protein
MSMWNRLMWEGNRFVLKKMMTKTMRRTKKMMTKRTTTMKKNLTLE